jgi:hypothetical protein
MLLDNDLKTEKMEQTYQKMKQTYQDGRWVISPNDHILSSKTGSLSREMSVDQISKVLGFEPNHPDDPDKVEYSWGATVYDTVTGESTEIAIWDYYGTRWSTYGDQDVIEQVFTCSS